MWFLAGGSVRGLGRASMMPEPVHGKAIGAPKCRHMDWPPEINVRGHRGGELRTYGRIRLETDSLLIQAQHARCQREPPGIDVDRPPLQGGGLRDLPSQKLIELAKSPLDGRLSRAARSWTAFHHRFPTRTQTCTAITLHGKATTVKLLYHSLESRTGSGSCRDGAAPHGKSGLAEVAWLLVKYT